MGQFKFVVWLAYWDLQNETFDFEWDSANMTKSSIKHGVSLDEVESLFNVVGPAISGKFISVVFTLRDGRVRPISSRIASRKERRLYEEVRKALEGL